MIMRLAFAALLFAVPNHALAQSEEDGEIETLRPIIDARADDVVATIQGTKKPEEIFSPVFLAAVPSERFGAISTQLVSQYGELEGVESVKPTSEFAGTIILRFEKALATVAISMDEKEPYLINGLLIQDFKTIGDTLEKIETELDALPGDVSVLFTRLDGTAPLMARDVDSQYAIGSTFKLYILSALARSIENGERRWSDVVALDRQSFPSGKLQDWPKGAPMTLQTLATLMISISDNTATDILLYEVGRDAVEAELLASGHSDPDKALPFLSTLQMFGLKGSPGNLAKYIAADENMQRAILADFEDDVGGNPNLVEPPRFVEPTAIDTVEWFASGRDLEKLLNRIADLSDPTARNIMAISPSMSQILADEWAYTGYKGGSEPGVLNLTWLLQDDANRWWMLSMSWNNTEASLDDQALERLSQRLLALANK